MRLGREALELAVPGPHPLLVEAGGAHERNPLLLVEGADPAAKRWPLQDPDDHVLLAAQARDLAVQLRQAALEDRRQLVAAILEDSADVGQRHAGGTEAADLRQSLGIFLRVAAVVGAASRGRPQEPDGVVVEERAPGEPERPSEPADGEGGFGHPAATPPYGLSIAPVLRK
ncbi:MAG TPA: hypothetical protein VF341_05830 [Anaeromyxobacteraceae bacterium]